MGLPDVKLQDGWPVPAGRPGPRHHPRTGIRRRWRRRHTWTVLVAVPLVTAAVVLGVLANSYQPLTYGSTGSRTLAYPGLPAAEGARTVNTFGGVREDIYVPPQRGTFYLYADIRNSGSRAVTIEAVTVPKGGPLSPAGPVRYGLLSNKPGSVVPPPAAHVLRHVTLGARQELFVAIPVRTWPCWMKLSFFETMPDFYVTYRFLFFTHTVAIPWGMQNDELIMHGPFGKPGHPGVVCASG